MAMSSSTRGDTSPARRVADPTGTLPVYERTVPTEYKYQPEIEVEVPDVHFHKLINHVPKITHQPVQEDVPVRHLHVVEKPELNERWETEEVLREIPRVTVREVVKTVDAPSVEVRREENYVDVEIPVPPRTIEVIKPRVVMETGTPTFVPVRQPDVQEPTETIEVPYVVQVPQINLVESERTRTEVVRHEVKNKLIIERAVEVPREEIVEKRVEVPVVTTEVTIRQKPRFVSGGVGADDWELEGADKLQAYVRDMERRRDEMKAQLEERLRRIAELQRELQAADTSGGAAPVRTHMSPVRTHMSPVRTHMSHLGV